MQRLFNLLKNSLKNYLKDSGGVEGPELSPIPEEEEDSNEDAKSVDSVQKGSGQHLKGAS